MITTRQKSRLKNVLTQATGCRVQHNGWPCGTCFFTAHDKLTNQDWQTVLYIRGDYKKKELDNLPKDTDAQFHKIIKLLKENL